MPSINYYFSVFAKYLIGCFAVLGCIAAFLFPPLQTPDESGHWSNASARMEKLVQRESRPCSKVFGFAKHFELGRIAFNFKEKVTPGRYANLDQIETVCDVGYGTTANITTYPGQVISRLVLPERPSHNSYYAVLSFYLARCLQGAILTFVLGYLLYRLIELRLWPRPGLLSIIAICLLPLFVQQSYSITPDMTKNCFALMIVLIIFIWDRLKWLDVILFTFFGIAAGSAKGYMLPLAIGIPCSLFLGSFLERRKTFTWHSLLDKKPQNFILVSFFLILLCSIYSGYVRYNPGGKFERSFVDVPKQIEFILGNKWTTTRIFFNGVVEALSWEKINGSLGWIDTPIPKLTDYLYRLILGLALVSDLVLVIYNIKNYGFYRQVKARLFSSALVTSGVFISMLLSILIIVCAAYLQLFPPGYPIVVVEGRYFHFFIIVFLGAIFTFLNPMLVCVTEKGTVKAWQIAISHSVFSGLLISYCVSFAVLLLTRYW